MAEAWQCSHARAVQERVERVLVRLEAQRDTLVRHANYRDARNEQGSATLAALSAGERHRAWGLSDAITALRGAEDG